MAERRDGQRKGTFLKPAGTWNRSAETDVRSTLVARNCSVRMPSSTFQVMAGNPGAFVSSVHPALCESADGGQRRHVLRERLQRRQVGRLHLQRVERYEAGLALELAVEELPVHVASAAQRGVALPGPLPLHDRPRRGLLRATHLLFEPRAELRWHLREPLLGLGARRLRLALRDLAVLFLSGFDVDDLPRLAIPNHGAFAAGDLDPQPLPLEHRRARLSSLGPLEDEPGVRGGRQEQGGEHGEANGHDGPPGGRQPRHIV